MGFGHWPRRSRKTGKFLKGRYRSHRSGYRHGRHVHRHRHPGHSRARWRVTCGGKTRSWHRKKSAANRSRPRGCRVVRV